MRDYEDQIRLALSILSGRYKGELDHDAITTLGWDWFQCIERGFPTRNEILGVCEDILAEALLRR